jgi:PAS domain S-box-containing protein
MLLTALCLTASILGYGAYTAKKQTDSARQTITAQMAALAQNLATINAFFLVTNDLASIETITLQTATVPGIFSVLVTDGAGKPLSEVVNQNGRWSPRFSFERVIVPASAHPVTLIETAEQSATQRDFLAGGHGKISTWHPVAEGASLGWVRVSYRLDSFDQIARDIWTQAMLVIALAIGATLFLLAQLLHPRMRALRAATRFAGDLDHALGTQIAVSTGSAEIEDLGNALNLVSTRLFSQNNDLTNQKFALDQHAIVSITDLNGAITYANDRFCEISGYAREELIGQNHRIVKSDFHRPEVYSELWHTITQGQVWHGEVKNRKKNGEPYWVAATIVPLLGPDGLPMQYIGIRTDITIAKDLEQSLQSARAAAETANLAKSEFLANMSHEIRTPMNGVIGMTELALDTELNAIQRNYLNTVKSSAHALLVILNDILDFSKIEAGKLDIEQVSFNLSQVIADALTGIEARTAKKGLTLTRLIPTDIAARMVGDSGRIRQVLTNLCDNAIKFTQHGGVTVRVHAMDLGADGHEVEIAVSDTGVGIPADKQQLIFAAFSQADSSTTRQFGGTGLGLTISSRLVGLMGGRIWVESTEGQGSTFHFTVRLGQSTEPNMPTTPLPQATHADTPPLTAPPQRPLRVLLVEDHAINQLLATSLLKKWGHTVVLARDGQEAVDLFPTDRWDIVLMDMQMPVMGGLEATVLIRAQEPNGRRTPIIAVTANAMETDREACLHAGMDDFLSKPINAAVLQTLLAHYS